MWAWPESWPRPQLQTWARLREVRAAIARLEAQRDEVARGVRELVVSAPNVPKLSPHVPELSPDVHKVSSSNPKRLQFGPKLSPDISKLH